MARSRNIKPGFFGNEVLADVHPLGRLLFAGLWTIADREGRLEDRPKKIKVFILPYDECDVDALLNDLMSRGFITRYTVAGTGYIQVNNWHKHQQPHIKEVASSIPAPDEHGARTVQNLDEHGISTEQEPLVTDSLLLIPDSLQTTTLPTVVVAVAEVAPPEPKAKKKAKPRGRDFTIQALALLPDQQASFDRLWTNYPTKGWDFRSKREQPRRINYGEAAQRFKEILDFTDVRHTDGSGIIPDELTDALLAWIGLRWAEAKRQGLPAPCIPCIGNLLSSVEGEKNHWKEALLTHFDAIPEAS
jgi:hypothetical protein